MRGGSPPPSTVTELGPMDYPEAGGVLGRAFYDDSQWVALMPDPDVRRARLPEMFTGAVKMTAAARGVPERTAGFEAVALWLTPGRDIGLWPMVRSGFAAIRWAMKRPFLDFRRTMAVLRQFDRRRKELMPEPHWYVMAIGVDPVHQGQGHGSSLMHRGMWRADLDGRPIYLEADTDSIASFYEKLGFEVIGEMTIQELDLPFSLMVRRPESAL